MEAQAALLRVRTGTECPEGNLREQPKLWDSQREKKERELSWTSTRDIISYKSVELNGEESRLWSRIVKI